MLCALGLGKELLVCITEKLRGYTVSGLVQKIFPVLAFVSIIAGCSTMPEKPMETVSYVDIERFMGDWYVIANIPTALEKGAHNAIESYRLADDGTIDTEFIFRQGSFDGAEKRYTPKGFIRNTSTNAEWGMRFIWPFKAEYLIVYLNDDYTHTVIGRSKRDYVWIMSRTPEIEDSDYKRILSFVAERGYDPELIKKVPQRWN